MCASLSGVPHICTHERLSQHSYMTQELANLISLKPKSAAYVRMTASPAVAYNPVLDTVLNAPADHLDICGQAICRRGQRCINKVSFLIISRISVTAARL